MNLIGEIYIKIYVFICAVKLVFGISVVGLERNVGVFDMV